MLKRNRCIAASAINFESTSKRTGIVLKIQGSSPDKVLNFPCGNIQDAGFHSRVLYDLQQNLMNDFRFVDKI